MRTLLLPLALIGCAAPDAAGFFNKLDVRTAADEIDVALEFLPVIEGAQDTLRIALPHGTYTPLTDAIIEADARRVDVEVVTDVDHRDDAGIVDLIEAGVPLKLADGTVGYFDFGFNTDVRWTSEQVIMSHAFAVADGAQVVNATSVGGEGTTPHLVMQIVSQEIAEDLTTEHNQLFAGSDATALTAFSAPAKSLADSRTIYSTDSDTPVELYFGPQERLTKIVIDGLYSARRSIRVMSNDIANAGINNALKEKDRWGFPVDVIIGPAFLAQGVGRGFGPTQGRPDTVNRMRITDAPDLPTIVLIDIEGGPDTVPRAYVISHDLYSAARFFGRSEIVTDQLIDGNLMLLHDTDYVMGEDAESSLQPIIDLFFEHQARAGAF